MSDPKNVLIVEDEKDLSELLAYNLAKAGFTPTIAPTGRAALEAVAARAPDLVLLDVMIPEFSGTEVAGRIRSNPRTASIPIIMLTAKAEEIDQIVGLAVGADDYITKPFSMKVLLARVEAVLRRSAASSPGSGGQQLSLGSVIVDLETHDASVDGEPMKLTLTEFRLLAALIQAAGKVLSRQSLMSKAMGPGVMVTDRTIDVHMTSIRKKLGGRAGMIKTVRGVGYRATAEADGVEAESAY